MQHFIIMQLNLKKFKNNLQIKNLKNYLSSLSCKLKEYSSGKAKWAKIKDYVAPHT